MRRDDDCHFVKIVPKTYPPIKTPPAVTSESVLFEQNIQIPSGRNNVRHTLNIIEYFQENKKIGESLKSGRNTLVLY